MKNTTTRIAAASLLALGLSTVSILAKSHQEPVLILEEGFKGLALAFDVVEAPEGLGNFVLTVSGPRNYSAVLHSKGKLPKIDLREFGKPFDGNYTYEITGATKQTFEVNTSVDENGRTKTARNMHMVPVVVNGNFMVREGQIVPIDKNEVEEK